MNNLTDHDSERTIITGMLKDKNKIDRAVLKISRKELDSLTYSTLFQIIFKTYVTHGSLITVDYLSNFLESFGVEQNKRLFYLQELEKLSQETVTDAEFNIAIDRVRAAYVTRSMADILAKTTTTLEAKGGLSAFATLDKKLYDLKLVTERSGNIRIGDLRNSEEFLAYLEDIRKNPDRHSGVKCGWKAIDHLTGGFRKGEYILVVSKQGGGKSMTMLNWADFAQRNGYNCAYISLEMPYEDLQARFMALQTGIDFSSIIKQEVKEEDIKKIEETVRVEWPNRRGACHIVDKTGGCTLGMIEAQLRCFNQTTPLDIVFIDYLKKIEPEVKNKTTQGWEVLADISESIKSLARSLNLVIVTGHQLTTEGAKKSSKDVIELEDISLSRRIADPTDMVFALAPDPTNLSQVKLSAPKCRRGYVPSTMLFQNLNTCRICDQEGQDTNFDITPPTIEGPKAFGD